MSRMLSKMNLISVVQQLPKEDIETIQGYVEMIEEEHRKLKDEIKKLERIIELCHLDAKETLATINFEQENQQKKFINYLQKEINQYTAHIDAINSYGISIYSPDYDNSKLKLAIYKEILQKYKIIIGGKND